MRECVLRSWPKFVFAVYTLCSWSLLAKGECEKALYYKLVDAPAPLKQLSQQSQIRSFRFPSANRLFENRFQGIFESDSFLFFHLENQKLKALNDSVIGNKDTSAVLLNLYKKIFHELYRTDFVLLKAQVPLAEGGIYSDYKTIRIAFSASDEASRTQVKKHLEVLLKKVALRFENETRALGISDDQTLWHLAAVGADPERASLAARFERQRKFLIESGNPVLPRLGEFNEQTERAFRRKIDEAKKNIELLGDLSPAIYARETESLFLFSPEDLKHGLISIDFAGLGAKNRQGVAQVLARLSPESSTTEILLALRLEQEKLSKKFEETQSRLIQTLKKFQESQSEDSLRFSGDELVWRLDHPLSHWQLRGLFNALKKALPLDQKIRVMVQPQTYQDSRVSLDPISRLDWAGKMEGFEKKLQEGLFQPFETLLVLEPQTPQKANLTLVVSPHDQARLQERIEQIQQENRFPHFDQIRLINPLF